MTSMFPNPDDESTSQVPLGSEDFPDEAEHKEPTEGGGLRKKLTEALARINELESEKDVEVGALTEQAMDQAFTDNGLSRHEGLGRAIAAQYDGEPSSEALAQHLLSEYDQTFAGAPNPIAAQITAAQARLDMASQGAGSVPIVPKEDEALSKAEAQGDYRKTMAIKSGQITDLLNHR
jgi:hypothetical protein